ncbi:hypothetical protein YERSI8AC_120001 [Enterobacterales bacterium 8AC]|nr:hypothetical protein YERSI8AC_120001 [Enterobacterales bacterium 8AC]
MRLLGRGWQESLIGAYEKPPAMPEDIYSLGIKTGGSHSVTYRTNHYPRPSILS